MKKMPVTVRIPLLQDEQVEKFAADASLTYSDALRRLIERGLGGEKGSVIADQKSLSDLASAVLMQSDVVTGIDLELRDLRPLVEEAAFQAQEAHKLAQQSENYLESIVKMLSEILFAARFLMDKADPAAFDKLGESTQLQFEMVQEHVNAKAVELNKIRVNTRRAHMYKRSTNSAAYRPNVPD